MVSNMRKALESAGLEVTQRYYNVNDIGIETSGDMANEKKLSMANNLYFNSDELSDDDVDFIVDTAIYGNNELIEFIKMNRDRVRKIKGKDLRKYRYVAYVSKRYGTAEVLVNIAGEYEEQIENCLSTGEHMDFTEAKQQDYIAVYIDKTEFIGVSYIKRGRYVTKPYLGSAILDRELSGELNLETFFEKGGIIHPNHFYLLHKNENKEYYLTRYRGFRDMERKNLAENNNRGIDKNIML